MVLKVNTTNFQSTAGKSYREPVNTFVEPVQVQPRTGIMDLAQSLATVNPVIQKYLSNVIEQEKQRGILEGQNKILSSTPEDINKIKKQLEKKEGRRIMRNFVGGNMYIEYGLEKQLAINLGNIAEGKTNQFFSNYFVQVPNKAGGTAPVHISQFDINSEEFQGAMAEFRETQLLDTKGIRPNLLNEFFLPQQNAALQKAITKQAAAKADANISNYRDILTDSSLLYFRNISKYDDSIEQNIIDTDFQDGESYALSLLQSDTNNAYKLGLTGVVSPSGMVEIIKKNGYRILNDFQQGNISWVDAQSELDDYIEFMSGITVGPSGTTKDGFPIQKTLGEFLEKDDSILKLKKEIYEKIHDTNKEESKLLELLNKKEIKETLGSMDWSSMDPTTYKNNVKTLKALVEEHKDLKQFIVKEYDLRNDNVDYWFDRFTRDYTNGKLGDKDKAKVRLDSFMAILGPTATDADRARYDKALKLLDKESPQGVLNSYPEFDRTLKNMKEALREDNKSGYVVIKVGYTNAFNDLSKRYRDKIDDWIMTDYKNEEDKNKAKKEIINFVQLETIKIVDGNYIFENPLLETLYYKANPNLEKPNKNKNKKKTDEKLNKYKKMAEGGPVKKDEPIIVGENPDGSINKTTELFVPRSDGEIIASNKTMIHEVKSGENLSTIADQYEGIEYIDIINFNKFSNDQANNLSIGQKIPLPQANIQESKEVLTQKLNEVLKSVDTTKPFKQEIINKMLLAVGFNENDARIMSAIGMAESAGDGGIDTMKSGLDPNKKKEFSIGLFQINMLPEFEGERFPLFGITSTDELYNPITNVIAAKKLFDKYGFEAWGAYKNNRYKDFLSN
jgi:hypothetical protein